MSNNKQSLFGLHSFGGAVFIYLLFRARFLYLLPGGAIYIFFSGALLYFYFQFSIFNSLFSILHSPFSLFIYFPYIQYIISMCLVGN